MRRGPWIQSGYTRAGRDSGRSNWSRLRVSVDQLPADSSKIATRAWLRSTDSRGYLARNALRINLAHVYNLDALALNLTGRLRCLKLLYRLLDLYMLVFKLRFLFYFSVAISYLLMLLAS